jgi:hypothetical protein
LRTPPAVLDSGNGIIFVAHDDIARSGLNVRIGIWGVERERESQTVWSQIHRADRGHPSLFVYSRDQVYILQLDMWDQLSIRATQLLHLESALRNDNDFKDRYPSSCLCLGVHITFTCSLPENRCNVQTDRQEG